MDHDPRRNPIAGDKMQIGRSIFYVMPERFKHHIAFRHPQTRQNSAWHVPLWKWRRMMANPEAIVVGMGNGSNSGMR